MADTPTPMKIKQLFSSFLSTFRTKDDTAETQNDSEKSPSADRPIEQVKAQSPEAGTKANERDDVTKANVKTVAKADEKSESTASEKSSTKSTAWNKCLFYDRVETYTSLSWFAKPLTLSPLVCARYGWVNSDTDMLHCVNCRAFLSGQLPKAVDTAGYRESCQKLEQSLIESHEKLCTWSSNPSPESFMNVPNHNRDELMNEFCHRVASLFCKMDKLPVVAYTSFEEQGVTQERMDKLVGELVELTKSTVQQDVPSSVAVFALCGWSYSELLVDALQCNYCRRKVGLWNYSHATNGSENQRSGHHTNGAGEDLEPARKRPKIEKKNFDPVGEHRYWCPWIQQATLFPARKPRVGTSPCPSAESSPIKSPPTDTGPMSDSHSPMLESQPASTMEDLQPASTMEDPQPASTVEDPHPVSTVEDPNQEEPAWLLALAVLRQRGTDNSDQDTFSQQMRQSPQIASLQHLRKVLRDCTSPPSKRKQVAQTET